MNYFKSILSLLLIALFSNCSKDFIVTDIKNKTVAINAPADNLTTPNNAITFWWDELNGAETYNLQIVKPDFNTIQQLLVDTTITGSKFNYTFSPGTYQWRVKAINAGGSTNYLTRSLVIDTTSDLSKVSVGSLFPNTNYLTGNRLITFSWNALDAATYYELEVKNNSNLIVINPTNILGTSYTYSFTNTTDANYSWRVRAHNSVPTSSAYNASRTFTIDVTAPNASSITYPFYGAISINSATDSLKWTRSISTGAKSDSIVISLDSTFSNYINTFKTYQIRYKIADINPTLTAPSPAGNNYYWWRIYSIDSVKNISAPSPKFKFKLFN